MGKRILGQKMIELPPQKTNYYLQSLDEIEKIKASGKRPKLLFHVCCGPCACWPLDFLCPVFDVTIYYNNSNIYPKEEFDHRLAEVRKLIAYYKRDKGYEIELIVPPYDYETYRQDLVPFAEEREGLNRCQICYRKRMAEAYDYADQHGYDYFTTVMTVSRQKNSQVMNLIGKELEKDHPNCKYFYSDFKKDNGVLRGKEIRLRYDLYNQNYCGCEYSLANRKER